MCTPRAPSPVTAMASIMAKILLLAFLAESSGAIRGNRYLLANVTHTLDTLLANNRYDKRLRPGFGGAPLSVSVNLAIKSMGPVSENDQSFGLDCYFRQHWYDWRLQYQKLPGLEELSMSWLFLDKVWKPDTFFVNGKKSYLHRITVPNKFLRLRYDGYITYSMRLTITANCPMYLRKFPLDAQRCPLIIGSYGYTNKDLVYEWSQGKAVGLEPGVEIAQFDILNVTTESEKIMLRGEHAFSTVQANFWLKRHTGYFMLQMYVPCCIIVICSWISFWIDPNAVPARVYVPCGLIVLSSWVSFWIDPDDVAARVALGVTTVLSLTTMGFGSRAQLPKVSYWTALDWFIIICFTSVFSVMIEYAVVNFIDKFTKDFKKIIQNRRKEEEAAKKLQDRSADFLRAGSNSNFRRTRSVSYLPKSPEYDYRRRSVATGSRSEEKTFEGTQMQSFTLPHFDKSLRVIRDTTERLSTSVLDFMNLSNLQRRVSKSISHLARRERDQREENPEPAAPPPKVIITSDEDLIDLETEVEEGEIVLDVESEREETKWEGVEETEEEVKKKRHLEDVLKVIKNPRKLWKRIKILPGESDIIDLLADPETAEKFSKIDIQARKNFPIFFLVALTIYLYAFSYYLTDDFPERGTDFLMSKQI